MQKLETVAVIATQWNGNTTELKKFFGANRVLVDGNDNATVVKNIENTEKNGAIEYKKTQVKDGYYCIKADENSKEVVVLSPQEAHVIFGIELPTVETVEKTETTEQAEQSEQVPEKKVKNSKN